MDENTMVLVAILVGFGILFLVYGAVYFFAWLFSSSRTVVYVKTANKPNKSTILSASNIGLDVLGQKHRGTVNVVLQAAAHRARKARK